MAPEKLFTLEIEKIVAGGNGLARLPDGMVAMVPGVLPGERVRVRVTRRQKQFAECELVALEQPAVDRVEPACPHYGQCGGCDLQHIAYPAQVRIKQEILRAHLVRTGLLSSTVDPDFLRAPCPSPRQTGYRLRLRLHVDEHGRLGMYRTRSNQVVPLRRCLIARPEINAIMARLGDCRPLDELLRQTRELEILIAPDEALGVLLLDFTRKPRPADLARVRQALAELPGVKGVYLRVDGHGLHDHQGRLVEIRDADLLHWTLPMTGEPEAVRLTIEPGGFYQVNQEQNENLVAQLLDFADLAGREQVLDLFCGMGNFSLPLARRCATVLGMDLQGAAVRGALRNRMLSGIDNVDFQKKAALDGARELAGRGARFDLVLLDPPRTGCREVLPFVMQLAPARLIYISCDPATLCRDLGWLVGSGPYRLEAMRMFDMFPHTSHLETMVLLHRVR